MSQPKKTGKLGAAAQVVNAVKNVYNQAAPVTSTFTPLKAADRAAAGNAAARGIAQEPTIRASEAFGRAREKGFKRVYQTQSDRTRVGGGNIGGSQFSALSLYDPKYADDVWGVMDEGTASRLKNLAAPEHLFTTMLGSEDQLKTNPVVFEKLKRLFMREVKAGNMPPALLIKINEKLANAKVGNEGPAMFGEGVDILDPDLWRNLDTFDKRAVVADMMRGEGVGGLSPYRMTKKGDRTIGGTIFDAPGTLRAETDPMLLHPEMGGDVETFAVGPRAFSLEGTSEYRPDKHSGFPTILQGKDQRVKYKPVPSRTFLKDWYKEWEASPNKDGNPRSDAEKKKGPGYYPLALGMEGKGLPSQEISDDWLKELWREGHAEGGEVHMAKGGLAHMAEGGSPDVGEIDWAAIDFSDPDWYEKLMGTYVAPAPPPPPAPAPAPVPAPVVAPQPVTSVVTPPQVTPPSPTSPPIVVAPPKTPVVPVKPPVVPVKAPVVPVKAPVVPVALKQITAVIKPPPPPAPLPPYRPNVVSPMQMREANNTINIVPTIAPKPYVAPYVAPVPGRQIATPVKPATSTFYSPAPASKNLTGPQIQATLKAVPVAAPVKTAPLPPPPPVYKAPVVKPVVTAPKPLTGPQVQATLKAVPIAAPIKLAPLPPPPAAFKPVVAKPALAPVAPKALTGPQVQAAQKSVTTSQIGSKPAPAPAALKTVTGPMIQSKLPPVSQQLAPVVKAPQPSVAAPAKTVPTVTPTPTRSSTPTTAASPITSTMGRMAASIEPTYTPTPDAPVNPGDAWWLSPEPVLPEPAPDDTYTEPPSIAADDPAFLDWLKSQAAAKRAGGSIRMANGGLAHMAPGGKALTGPQLQAQMGTVSRTAPSKYPSYMAPKTPPPPSPVRRYVAPPPPPPPPPPKKYAPPTPKAYPLTGPQVQAKMYSPAPVYKPTSTFYSPAKPFTPPSAPATSTVKSVPTPNTGNPNYVVMPDRLNTAAPPVKFKGATGGAVHMAPGGVIGTAPRAVTSYMGTAFKPFTPPSVGPYKAPPKPYYPVAPPTAPRYVAPPPIKRSPSPSVYTPPATQPRLFYTEPPSVARRNVTAPVPSLPSKYPSYVLPPAPTPKVMNFNLSKLGGGPFKDGGGVESLPEGVIRHMKRAAIAARMHKAGGRVNG